MTERQMGRGSMIKEKAKETESVREADWVAKYMEGARARGKRREKGEKGEEREGKDIERKRERRKAKEAKCKIRSTIKDKEK